MRRLALTLVLVGGCMGPLLHLPPPAGAHLVYCHLVTCHQLGADDPLRPSGYDAARRVCTCHYVDSRDLPQYQEVDPHVPR